VVGFLALKAFNKVLDLFYVKPELGEHVRNLYLSENGHISNIKKCHCQLFFPTLEV
jgi:hypothetical protein